MGCVFSKHKETTDDQIEIDYGLSMYLSDSEIADLYWKEYNNNNKRFY